MDRRICPDWQRKIFDETIAAKWKEEALNTRGIGIDITQKMVDWCIAELKYKAGVFNETNCIETLDGVWKSDTIVPQDHKLSLQRAVASLEDIPETDKDWHPNTNEQVLDLVHPSLYPLVYGQSTILPKENVASTTAWLPVAKARLWRRLAGMKRSGMTGHANFSGFQQNLRSLLAPRT
ncbi:MAG: hypothetical protein Q9163_000736 [Psora crenata]